MQVNITARHIKLTPAIAEYVQKKLEKAKRYFEDLIRAQVILDVEKNRHIAEIVIRAAGRTFTAKEESLDLYAAVDLASDKIDMQLRRYKDRVRVHRPDRHKRKGAEVWEAPEQERISDVSTHRVSSQRTLRLIELSLPEAIAAMEQSDSAHWIFTNDQTQRVTVVYRKPDKTYGVVEAIS
jgi:putative sigma-54 modulation protein